MSNVAVENLDAVLEAIGELGDTKNLGNALEKACALVERSAKQKAPKGTGELRNSITSRIDTTGGEISGVVYTPVEYAPYVEFGTGLFAEGGNGRKDVPWAYKDEKGEWHSTSGMHPQPFLRPALDDNRTQIIKILREGMGND